MKSITKWQNKWNVQKIRVLEKHLVIITLLNCYDVSTLANEEIFIAPITDFSKPVKYFVSANEVFNF